MYSIFCYLFVNLVGKAYQGSSSVIIPSTTVVTKSEAKVIVSVLLQVSNKKILKELKKKRKF